MIYLNMALAYGPVDVIYHILSFLFFFKHGGAEIAVMRYISITVFITGDLCPVAGRSCADMVISFKIYPHPQRQVLSVIYFFTV